MRILASFRATSTTRLSSSALIVPNRRLSLFSDAISRTMSAAQFSTTVVNEGKS